MILLTEIVEPAIVIAHLRFIRRRFGMGGIEIPTQLFEDGFFAPEIVDNLSTAFEAAWQNLLASNRIGITESARSIARQILAQHIMTAAQNGERNLDRLVQSAVEAMTVRAA